jgi:ribokinase
MTRVAVVGHVEWVDFVLLDAFPETGQIAHAEAAITRAAGGGGVAAAVLAEAGAQVEFFCALGRDADGEAAAAQLSGRGLELHVAWRDPPTPTRRAVTLLIEGGERTIVTIGERLQPLGEDELPWPRLGEADAVYFTAGDAQALTFARRARVLVASPRGREALEHADVHLDALVYSAEDVDEVAWARRIADRARLLVATQGAAGGRWWGESEGHWDAVAPPGEPRDSYGCGDSFAAAFTCGLGAGLSVAQAAALGAERGALCLTRVGAP